MDSTMPASKDRPAILGHYHSGLTEEHGHKTQLAKIMSSRGLDVLILVLILLDLVCVSVESTIDLHIACVNGAVVPLAREKLIELGNSQTNDVESGAASLAQSSVPTTDALVVTARGAVDTAEESSSPKIQAFDAFAPAGILDRVRRSKAMRPRPPPQRHLESLESLDHGVASHPRWQGNFTPIAFSTKQMEEEDETPTALVCETRSGPTAHHIAHTAHKLSIYILVIFTVEIFLKIYVNPKHFFSNHWEVLDLVVVLVSLAFDTVIEGMFEEVVEVLIVVRLWRVVRIVHGFVEVMDSDAEYIKELKEELERTQERCEALEKRSSAVGAS
jgi:hypothetical protein